MIYYFFGAIGLLCGAKVTKYSQKQTFFGDYFVLSASLINFADVKNTIQILKNK